MSLTVKHLNADATFLLTFAPAFAPVDSKHKFPGSYTILLDPWLDGDSVIYHPKFANSRHSTPPAIKSLAELEHDLDLIIVSQEKADHLSRATLCSLPKDTRVRILATAKAAKKIRAWKYFINPSIIRTMHHYKPGKEHNIIRIPLEPYSSVSADGEITIANISETKDFTGLHNAVGITYCPPGTVLTSWNGGMMKLESMPVIGEGEPAQLSRADWSDAPAELKHSETRGRTQERDFVVPLDLTIQPEGQEVLLKPFAPLRHVDSAFVRPSTSGSRAPGITTVDKRPDNHEKVMSVIYSPHGLDAAAIKPYVHDHLTQLNHALPVTALFHCLNMEMNPWWLGGTVLKGAPSGVEIIKEAGTKNWISTHDEVKELKGFATKFTKSQRYGIDEVVEMLQKSGRGTEVSVVACGETKRFT